MKAEMNVRIALTPIFEQDTKTNMWMVYFKEFPRALASGDTKPDAHMRLMNLFQTMFQERSQEMKETIINDLLTDDQKSNLGLNLVV